MVERIVLLKLPDTLATDAGRAEAAAESKRQLGAVPTVDKVEVALAADPASLKSWDVRVRLTYADLDAMEAYKVHPTHVAYVAWLDERGIFRKAWSFAPVA